MMTEGQWFGVVLVLVGVYFLVAATWFRGFWLYKMKAERIARFIGERASHVFYQLLGAAFIVCGVLQALGIWVV